MPRLKRVSRRILVVDDDPGVTASFSHQLTLEGFEVRTAPSAGLGLADAKAHRPDAVILDLRMPTRDGLEFLRDLREYDGSRSIQVAVVTGDYFIEDDVSAQLACLGAEIRFKPLWIEELVDLARTLLKVPS
jgi:DNA-binding response OmpR family regulator